MLMRYCCCSFVSVSVVTVWIWCVSIVRIVSFVHEQSCSWMLFISTDMSAWLSTICVRVIDVIMYLVSVFTVYWLLLTSFDLCSWIMLSCYHSINNRVNIYRHMTNMIIESMQVSLLLLCFDEICRLCVCNVCCVRCALINSCLCIEV